MFIHTQMAPVSVSILTLTDPLVKEVKMNSFKFYIPPILATLFIFPLFPFSINLITSNETSWMDDSTCKRNLLFFLISLQFIPVLLSLEFTVVSWERVSSVNLLIEHLIANILFLISSLLLKFGNYQKDEDSEF